VPASAGYSRQIFPNFTGNCFSGAWYAPHCNLEHL
jgi:hypothetical protein